MRADSLAALPADDPSRLACEAILAGESMLNQHPAYFHVAMVEDASQGLTLEEEPQGESEIHDTPLDARWDIFRQPDLTNAQCGALVGATRARLGQRYGWEEYVTIGGVRVLHLPLGHPSHTSPAVCSVVVAESEAEIGVYPWKSRGLDPTLVTPSDYPGDGMVLFAQAGQVVLSAEPA